MDDYIACSLTAAAPLMTHADLLIDTAITMLSAGRWCHRSMRDSVYHLTKLGSMEAGTNKQTASEGASRFLSITSLLKLPSCITTKQMLWLSVASLSLFSSNMATSLVFFSLWWCSISPRGVCRTWCPLVAGRVVGDQLEGWNGLSW